MGFAYNPARHRLKDGRGPRVSERNRNSSQQRDDLQPSNNSRFQLVRRRYSSADSGESFSARRARRESRSRVQGSRHILARLLVLVNERCLPCIEFAYCKGSVTAVNVAVIGDLHTTKFLLRLSRHAPT